MAHPFWEKLAKKPAPESGVLKTTMLVITPEKFNFLTGIVIDNFEGGYYHPDMLPWFKESDRSKLAASGETMFGLDRKAGAQLSKYPEWKVFWEAVDRAKRADPDSFRYNRRGGKAGPELKELTAAIMYKWFTELSEKYLTHDSIEAIANDDRLIIHFSYASWNGEGWFKKFALALNAAKGTKEQIFQAALKARTESSNKVIRQQGVNMLNLFAKLHL